MELDDRAKQASEKLTDAVNGAAAESGCVSEAVTRLREMGYEPRLTFQLELAPISPPGEPAKPGAEIEEDFTEDDRRALRRMLIRVR